MACVHMSDLLLEGMAGLSSELRSWPSDRSSLLWETVNHLLMLTSSIQKRDSVHRLALECSEGNDPGECGANSS